MLKWRNPTFLTLVALTLGIACGLVIHASGEGRLTSVTELAAALGTLTTNALRLTVIPLIFAMLVVATSARSPLGVGRIVGFSPVLTQRQREVLALMMIGKSNKAICRALDLAEPTVKVHVSAILKALKASNRTEAVVTARTLGFGSGQSRE